MSCANVNSIEYKQLTKGLDQRQQFVARAVVSKYMTENNGKLPDSIELKSIMSDLYNTNQGGIDYQAFYSQVRGMFKALIPSLTEAQLDKTVKFVDSLELMRLRDGLPVLTSFINGTVYVANSLIEERGTQAYTDVRHEIFHTIFNNFLASNEQVAMAESFKRWKPEFAYITDKVELEEKMADSFEEFRFKGKPAMYVLIKEFFMDLLRFFKIIGDHYSDIQKLFNDVEQGKFTRNQIRDGLVTRDKNIIADDDRYSTNLDAFLRDKAFVLNNLNELMFPENVTNLLENSNKNLFLVQDYKSPLFQNNKESFKLGLTKNDALKTIQKRIEALKNDKTVDSLLADTIEALSSPTRLKNMFNYLQPYSLARVLNNGELVLEKQADVDSTEELLEADEDVNALQIGSKEFINPVTKISEVVKDFLSSITYPTSQGNVINIDPGAGFVALLNLLGNMYGNTSIEDNLESLKKAYNITTKGNQTKAVYNKLKDLHEAVMSKDRMTLNIKGVTEGELKGVKEKLDNAGIKYEIFKDNMNLILPSNMSIKNVGNNDVNNKVVFEFNRYKEGRESFLKEQKPTESNKTFVERIANETDIPSFVIAKLFRYNEQRNQLAELTKVANSLRKLSPKFVKVTTTRVTDQDSGQTGTATSFAFIDSVKDYRTSGSLASVIRDRLDLLPLRKQVINRVREYEAAKKSGNKQTFRTILKNIVTDKTGLSIVSEDDFNKITDADVSILLNNLTRVVTFVPDFSSDKASEDFTNSDVYLKHTSNFSRSLNRYTSEKNNPTSFQVSTSNKSKWENIMPNTGYKIFKNLEDFASGLIGESKLIPFLKNSFNNYLRFNPILQHDYSNGNFEVNGAVLKVGEEDFFSDHQETYFDNRNGFYQKPPIPFNKESPRDWINRNFLAMFQLPVIEATSASKTERANMSYFQQKFQPESAPNVSVVKMGINSSEELREGFMNMILQEAYMNHLNGGSVRGNLRKNSAKSFLPGLEGSTYFLKNGQNIFFDGAGNLNPEFGQVKNSKLAINKSSKELNRLVDTILGSLDNSMTEFVDMAINEKATLDGTQLAVMYDKLKNSYPKAYQLSAEELATLKGVSIDGKTDIEALRSQDYFEAQKEALKKVMAVYYLNSYVNGFFMNQLSSGATQNYKNPLDEIKRQAGVNAMNDTGLIDDQHGMPTEYRNVVISAANNFYGQSHAFAKIPVLQRFFKNKKQEIGDAQSWDIPEYKALLKKSFGKSVDIGVITKDVHFEVNEQGGVDYRKTSSAELTNQLVQKNKTLRDLRFAMTFQPYLNTLEESQRQWIQPRVETLYNKMVDNDGLKDVNEYMEYQDYLQDAAATMIHKASFDSAIKGSKPSKLSSFVKDQTTGTFNFNLEPQSVLSLNSSFNGIQQAVRHRYIDDFISHFTQLTYLIGLNRTETSIKNNKTITRTLAKFAKSGIYDTLFDFRMAYKDDKTLRANLRSRKEFIKELKKKLGLPGNERLLEMLEIPGISMNNPLFSEKLMQSFFNGFTKKTVSPKHPGGSFVLQSEFGFEANKILATNSLRTPEIVIEDGKLMYAECYLPEMYSDQLKHGDLIYYNSEEYNKMFGFRIPSSDLHSSVPLKVIGYYPSQAHDNVVVIPAAVTALHGSDFDVDKLFVVRQGVFGVSDEEKDPKDPDQETPETSNKREYKTRFQTTNITLAQKGIKFGFTAPNAEYDSKGNIVSFGQDDKHTAVFNMDSVLIDEKEKTQNRIIALEIDMEAKGKLKAANYADRIAKRNERAKIEAEIDGLQQHLKQLGTIQKGLYSNTILNAVLDNISYSGENAEDILFGITFDPVKGYEEDSEYSQLARVFSDINKANGVDDLLTERPKLYKNLQEALDADAETYSKIEANLRDNLGVDVTTKEGQEDLLSLINEDLKDSWIDDRDEFIRRQRDAANMNINKVEQHVNIHKDTYMAAGLVGLIANFSKGLSYMFHGITNDTNVIELDIPEEDAVEIDGETFNSLVLTNKDNIKNQELRSLALNAAIDHVKEQILNVLNVGNNTAKIFLAAISTKMNMHQATMLMLQPVAKELNSSNATTIASTLSKMGTLITEKLQEMGKPLSEEDLAATKVTTKELEKHVQTSFTDIYNEGDRKKLLLQFKVLQQLTTLNLIGGQVSDVSAVLSVIQGLPYNLESAYDKLKVMDNYINIDKFFTKLAYTEKSEYTTPGFKDDLRNNGNILKNVNLANNENVLAALEAIKIQLDVASEIFSENSVQAQFIVNNMLKAVSNNSDPATMFTGENDQNLTFDTVKNMSNQEKYLKGRNTFNLFKMISRNIFNYLTTGLNISYNNNEHLFSLSISNQDLTTIKKDDQEFQLTAVKSYLNAFLMKEAESYTSTKNYNGDDFVVSQINPEWRLKPLAIIKKQNSDNKFLRGVGIDSNFKDKVRVMTFNSSLVNTAENLAEIEQAVNAIGGLSNIYVRKDNKDRWVDVPSSLHPVTPEMNEVVFNIIKASVYTDKLKFGSNKVTNVLPPIYFKTIFQALQTLTKDLLVYNKSATGNKYYKDFADLENQTKQESAMANIKENLFVNTMFSLPGVLPNLRTVIPAGVNKWKVLNRQGGIMNNGNIYDLYFDANILDKTEQTETQGETTNITVDTTDNTNVEVTEDISENSAQEDLFDRLRKNPSFIVDEDSRKPGNYEIYMKVGTTGSKESNDLKYYYKKLGNVNGAITNSSFDLNLLMNKYKISDYFNPKRLAIPVKGVDFSGEKVTLNNVKISSFMVAASDDLRTKNTNKEVIKEAQEQAFQQLKANPENKFKTDEQLRSEVRTKINVENVINQVNEVSLYDSRNLDRVGIRNFKILSRKISDDKKTVSFELEALPKIQQVEFNKFDTPLELLKTLRTKVMTREEKMAQINSIPGAETVTTAQNLTDAELDLKLSRAIEIDEAKEINKVLKDKSCK